MTASLAEDSWTHGLQIASFSKANAFNVDDASQIQQSLQNALRPLVKRTRQNVNDGNDLKYDKATFTSTRAIILLYVLNGSEITLSQIRHDPGLKKLECDYDLEIVMDLYPIRNSLVPPSKRPVRLALFDMDSTLINEEVIDELARSIGKTEQVSAITARAMNGEIDFETSLRERVAMLKGVRNDVWDDLKRTVTIAEGARELVKGLKEAGAITVVVSGGFMPMATWLKEELGLDHAFANHVSAILRVFHSWSSCLPL